MRSLVLCALLLAAVACSSVGAVRMRSMQRQRADPVQEPVTSLEGRVLPAPLVAQVFKAQQKLQTDLPVNPDYSPLGAGHLGKAHPAAAKPIVSPAVQIAEAILASPVAQQALADRVHEENVKKLNELPAGATKPVVWQSNDGTIYRMDSKGFPILDEPQSGITNAVVRMIKEEKELKEGWAAEDALRKADYAAQQAQQAAVQQQQAAAFAQAQAIAVAQQRAAAQAAALKAGQTAAMQAAAARAAALRAAAAQAAAAKTAAGAVSGVVQAVPTPTPAAPTNTGIVGSLVKTWQDARAAWGQLKGDFNGVGQAVKAAWAQPQPPIQLTAQLEASLPGLTAQLSKQLNVALLELPRIEEGTVEAPMTFVEAESDAEADADADEEDMMSEEERAEMEIDADAEALAEIESTEAAEAGEEEELNASSDPKQIFAAARHFRAAAREAAPAEDHPSLAGFADQPDPSRVDVQSVGGIQQGFHNPQNQAQVWAVEKQ